MQMPYLAAVFARKLIECEISASSVHRLFSSYYKVDKVSMPPDRLFHSLLPSPPLPHAFNALRFLLLQPFRCIVYIGLVVAKVISVLYITIDND